MFTFRHPASWALALIVTALISLAFCSTGHVSEVSKVVLSATAPARAPKEPAYVTVKAEPGTVAIDGNRVARQVLDVEYSILEPASVKSATLELEGPEGGVLAEMPVPIQASGRVRFDIDAPNYTVAPVMRFRAACPEGQTTWHTVGVATDAARDKTALAVTGVVRLSKSIQEDQGARVSIRGTGLTPACTFEAEVNGSPLRLSNVVYTHRSSFETFLMFRDIGYHDNWTRAAKLKLRIKGTGPTRATTADLPFQDSGVAAR